MRSEGYVSAVVEKYISQIKQRKDLYGFIDIVGIRPDRKGILGVQSTSGTNLSARYKKAIALPEFDLWIMNGNWVEFHGWRKIKQSPTSKRKVWKCRRILIDEDSLRKIRCDEVAEDTTSPPDSKVDKTATPL